jgi:hypothetical protein
MAVKNSCANSPEGLSHIMAKSFRYLVQSSPVPAQDLL